VADVGEVGPRLAAEDLVLSAVDLPGRLEEQPGVRDEVGQGDPVVGEALLAAGQVLRHEGPVGEGQHVDVHCVHLAEGVAQLPGLEEEAAGGGGEGDVRLLHPDLVRAVGEEEVGAGVGIDDRLEAELGLVQLEGGLAAARGLPDGADEVADGRDVGVEDLGAGCGASVQGQVARGTTRSRGSRRHRRRVGPGRRAGSGRRRHGLQGLDLRRQLVHLGLEGGDLALELLDLLGARGRLSQGTTGDAEREPEPGREEHGTQRRGTTHGGPHASKDDRSDGSIRRLPRRRESVRPEGLVR
jgi:hypothetical protein